MGDSVSVDEVVCEIETDKTSVPVSIYPLLASVSDPDSHGSALFEIS